MCLPKTDQESYIDSEEAGGELWGFATHTYDVRALPTKAAARVWATRESNVSRREGLGH
jgi:hypothetical protein